MTIRSISALEHSILPHSVANWHDRAIVKLNSLEHRLDVKLPNWTLQTKYDHLVHFIEEKMAPLHRLNTWIDSNGEGSFASKLAIGLAKLPLRVARNLIVTLFKLIHAILDTLVHPVKSLLHLGKFLVDLLHAMTEPQTWAKIGAGLTGATLGQAWVLATPVGLISMLIGTALMIAGISAEAILAAYHAERGNRLVAAKDAALQTLSKLPESFATGLVIGLITGAIQRSIQSSRDMVDVREVLKTKFYERLKERNIPLPSQTNLDRGFAYWSDSDLQALLKAHPELQVSPSIVGVQYDFGARYGDHAVFTPIERIWTNFVDDVGEVTGSGWLLDYHALQMAMPPFPV